MQYTEKLTPTHVRMANGSDLDMILDSSSSLFIIHIPTFNGDSSTHTLPKYPIPKCELNCLENHEY